MKSGVTEFEKFDTVMKKVLSVSHDELEQREKQWKRKSARKRRAKALPASRASATKA
jgi:hypothetical protein